MTNLASQRRARLAPPYIYMTHILQSVLSMRMSLFLTTNMFINCKKALWFHIEPSEQSATKLSMYWLLCTYRQLTLRSDQPAWGPRLWFCVNQQRLLLRSQPIHGYSFKISRICIFAVLLTNTGILSVSALDHFWNAFKADGREQADTSVHCNRFQIIELSDKIIRPYFETSWRKVKSIRSSA